MLTIKQVAQESGATLRQLQYWHERGILVPAFGIHCHKRRYSEEQVEIARRLRLVSYRGGHPLEHAKRLVKMPWKRIRWIDGPAIIGDVLVLPTGADVIKRWALDTRQPKQNP